MTPPADPRATLRALVAAGEKATPGEWEADQAVTWDQSCGINPQIVQRNAYLTPDDATFIASCAGNAEAGWRATRAAIATALNCESWDYMIKAMYIRQDAEAILESILAAFPLEILNPQKP